MHRVTPDTADACESNKTCSIQLHYRNWGDSSDGTSSATGKRGDDQLDCLCGRCRGFFSPLALRGTSPWKCGLRHLGPGQFFSRLYGAARLRAAWGGDAFCCQASSPWRAYRIESCCIGSPRLPDLGQPPGSERDPHPCCWGNRDL